MHMNEIYARTAAMQGRYRTMDKARTVVLDLAYKLDRCNRIKDEEIIKGIASAEACINELKYSFSVTKCDHELYELLEERKKKL